LTNAHRRRVLVTVDLRELHHMARLRMDHHAQWDIHRTTASLVELARGVAPAAAALACGKDAWGDVRARAFREANLDAPGGSG
jgi:thymidylate synthase ThyX